ncbi:MAG: oxidoreductase [Alphaproteobacteria bacterium]|jgi:anthraniloyl-CoA monooxygenase
MSNAQDLPPMFTPYTLRGMTVKNRVAVSPMCMYSATEGAVGDFQLVHLGARALGGAGLIITEMTNIRADGRISLGCAGLYEPEHVAPWKRVVDFVHDQSDAKICVQLAHAGRKGATPRGWERGGDGLGDAAWELAAPSAIPFGPDSATPKAMSKEDIEDIRKRFVQGAIWAEEAGFDMIELHGGHGYLLSSFMSPLSNHRDDEYGGDMECRMRFPLEVLRSVREVWPEDKPISMRISAIDYEEGGNTIEDGITMSQMLFDAGLDIVDVSSGNVTSHRRPSPDGLFQTPFSEAIRNATRMPTMTVGNIRSGDDVNAVIADGRADICAIAKWHLFDPSFTYHAAYDQGVKLPWPKQYLNVQRMFG